MRITNETLLRLAPSMEMIQRYADSYYTKNQISMVVYQGMLNAMKAAQMDKRYSVVDNLLLSSILRLDRAGVHIVPGKHNVFMTSEALVDAMANFDYESEGDLGFIPHADEIQYYSASSISKTIIMLQVCTGAKFGEARGKKEVEFRDLFNALAEVDSAKMRLWTSKQCRRQLVENLQFARYAHKDKAVPYLNLAEAEPPQGDLKDLMDVGARRGGTN